MTESEKLFRRAVNVLPGGVNSPVRACRNVGMEPRFVQRAHGAHLWDADGREYIDYVCSWGPMILGHGDPKVLKAVQEAMEDGLSFGAPTGREVEMAELMCAMVPGLEMVRMVSSGTEAVMSAVRLARGATGRPGVIKFEGCYHGHSDSLLVKAGSGLATFGTPDSAGVTPGTAADTCTAVYNDAESVRRILEAHPDTIACVIVEPAAANMGVVPPQPGFLADLRQLCDRFGTLLIFDEVITGFRLAAGGAQEAFGVRADLVTYGKIIGGGLPVGAYGGSRRLMEQVAPCGPVYQAGTLSGNPAAMAAGLAQLRILQEDPGIFRRIDRSAEKLEAALREAAARHGIPAQVNRCGSLLSIFFTDRPVTCWQDADRADRTTFARWYRGMLDRGIWLAPSQFEAMFLSEAHGGPELEQTAKAADEVMADLAQAGNL